MLEPVKQSRVVSRLVMDVPFWSIGDQRETLGARQSLLRQGRRVPADGSVEVRIGFVSLTCAQLIVHHVTPDALSLFPFAVQLT